MDFTCTNHIRVYHQYPGNPDLTLVCGTNAGNPECRLIEVREREGGRECVCVCVCVCNGNYRWWYTVDTLYVHVCVSQYVVKWPAAKGQSSCVSIANVHGKCVDTDIYGPIRTQVLGGPIRTLI